MHPWRYAEAVGWQHGDVPKPPAKLSKSARDAWETWFSAWFAWFWGPEDVPGLRHLVMLYNAVERGELRHVSELRRMMDGYGLTPKGQQDRRWCPPAPPEECRPADASDRHRRLRVIDELAAGAGTADSERCD